MKTTEINMSIKHTAAIIHFLTTGTVVFFKLRTTRRWINSCICVSSSPSILYKIQKKSFEFAYVLMPWLTRVHDLQRLRTTNGRFMASNNHTGCVSPLIWLHGLGQIWTDMNYCAEAGRPQMHQNTMEIGSEFRFNCIWLLFKSHTCLCLGV